MVWSKHKIIPPGFTDFKWKKSRFIVDDALDFKGEIDFRVVDSKTQNRWWVEEWHENSKTIGDVLNNLYERNGYLRRECSKQTFLANKYKKDAERWEKGYDNILNQLRAEQNETNYWYNKYQFLKTEIEKQKKEQETDWGKIKRC